MSKPKDGKTASDKTPGLASFAVGLVAFLAILVIVFNIGWAISFTSFGADFLYGMGSDPVSIFILGVASVMGLFFYIGLPLLAFILVIGVICLLGEKILQIARVKKGSS